MYSNTASITYYGEGIAIPVPSLYVSYSSPGGIRSAAFPSISVDGKSVYSGLSGYNNNFYFNFSPLYFYQKVTISNTTDPMNGGTSKVVIQSVAPLTT